MRNLILLGTGALFGAVLVLGIGWMQAASPPIGVSVPSFSKLRVGMTKAEVEHVLGQGKPPEFAMPNDTTTWASGDGRKVICAEFNDDGTLQNATLTIGVNPFGAGPPGEEPDETLLDRILRFFRG